MTVEQNAKLKQRGRTQGLPFSGRTGNSNAITDVAGVQVGTVTLISGEGPLVVGQGPVRTGVTAILPRGRNNAVPCAAGSYSFNGNGEMTGLAWIEEAGELQTPITITNTSSCGVARDATLQPHQLKRLARRVPLGLERTGTVGNNSSGDIFLAFSTANEAALSSTSKLRHADSLANSAFDGLFRAVVEATEEAVLDSMICNETMLGRDGNTAIALPIDQMLHHQMSGPNT